MTKYTTSILSIIVKPPADRLESGEIQITPEEWPVLRSAINKMVKMCRD